jgi:nitrous oxidase accessory protein NosD
MRVAALVCGIVVWTMLLAVPAAATHVSCGEVITQDTTLDSDLADCPGDGVVIGASGITLDLAGHTIDGDRDGDQGVENNGADDVTVSNGRIQQFQDAALVRLGGANVLSDLELTDSGIAVNLEEASFTRIRDSTITRAGAGVLVFREGSFIEIDRNVISSTGTAIFIAGFGLPTDLVENTTITDNHVFGNETGILVGHAFQTLIAGNSVHGNLGTAGIIDQGGASRIEQNIVRGNSGHGIFLQRRGKQVVGNRVVDNGEDGVAVFQTAAEVELTDNFARGNGDDGIDSDTPDAVLTRNKAIHNGDFGIEAVPGVTDGGGNKASANGNPLQCLNVSCK